MKAIKTVLQILLLSTTIIACNAQTGEGYKDINETEFAEKAGEENTVIIDVRTPGEVANGYISGADLFIDISDSEFEQRMNELDKDKTYLVYCQSGGRSSQASDWMAKNGFLKVYNLSGGISGWSGEIEK